MRRLLAELRQRNVFKVAAVYVAAGWLLMQVVDIMFPSLGLPPWTMTLVVSLLILGFPIALVLAWALELTPEGIRRAGEALPSPAAAGDGETAPGATASVLAGSAPSNGGSKSIAVLPFADMSPDHDNEYFSDGLTEELLNVLTRVPNLRVSSRTSCFAFKGKDADIRTVVERLQVSHIVEGSVRKAGDRIRITAQLIEAESDSHLWSETWDRGLGDIFAVQDDIAQNIVRALALKLRPEDQPDATTQDPRAYDFYLKGLSFHHRFGPKSQGYAIDLFERATAIDAGFAKAWAGLAGAHAVLAVYHGGGETALAASDEASRKAVELAPDLAETHTARAISYSAMQRFDEAAREFEHAIRLNPRHYDAWYYYARTALHQHRPQRALELFERAAEVNPDDYQTPLLAAPIYRSLGMEGKALENERRGVMLAERHVEDYPDNARAYFLAVSSLASLGRMEQALEWTERAIAIDPDDPQTRYNVACFYAQVGETEKALDYLENSVMSRSWLESDPELEPLRSHPRYLAIVASLDG
ncbi:MAG TPA: tetratricopeptide repeat protein [Gammaproteobacteria bacterium]|nr:tetratricopeptide repeat protein [Gammaproteobacteria bacterium]